MWAGRFPISLLDVAFQRAASGSAIASLDVLEMSNTCPPSDCRSFTLVAAYAYSVYVGISIWYHHSRQWRVSVETELL